jgi:D-glycero-D-manno-heptose 1,7-bisphosphate phosphatase
VKAAAFLDRDGVLNASIMKGDTPCPPSNISEVEILPGVREAIEILNFNNYLPVVITNQPDVARGTRKLSEVQFINHYISRKINVSNFYVCPHDDRDQCMCRKPKPGLINLAVAELEIDLTKSFLVGDRWRDIEVGQSMGLPSFFVDYAYREPQPKLPFTRVGSLLEAVNLRIEVDNGFDSYCT